MGRKQLCKRSGFELTLLIATCAVLLVLLVSHTYNDIVVTTRHGIEFWEILGRGDFFDFYGVNQTVSGNDTYTKLQGCAYNILVYVVFAIWNLPLLLLRNLANVDVMNSIPCLVYAKLLPVAALLATVFVMKRILKSLMIPEEKHGLILYLYVASSLVISAVFITAQYDMLSVIFQLLGVYAFLERKDKWFVFWFGIAFCFKFFALVIFIPLLVLRDKRIFAWIKKLAMLMIPWILTEFPFAVFGSVTATTGGGLAKKLAFEMLYSANLGSSINLFVAVYVGVVVWCYLRKPNSETAAMDGIWACFVSYAAFFATMDSYPYWSVMLAPFVALIIALTPAQLYLNLILETVALAALMILNMLRYHWCYFGDTLKPMIWSRLLQGTPHSVAFENSWIHSHFMSIRSVEDFRIVVASVCVAALCALAYTTYPRRQGSLLQQWKAQPDCRDILVIRLLVNAGLCLLPILAIFI